MILMLMFSEVIFAFNDIPRPDGPVGKSGFIVSETDDIGFSKIRQHSMFLEFKTFGSSGIHGCAPVLLIAYAVVTSNEGRFAHPVGARRRHARF